ncbi:thiaminase II [Alkalicoccus chagannorensis]|uniref:thiaminase II n=1 Tax=Alkalicoccus chagannorensis TaxID=427072 RepID=UPI00041C6137|nr:thiaminase II [Alkalicoccus chagannorensis]
MSFSAQLRKETAPLFQAILEHPFVEGIGRGEVPREALVHYVKQDYEYLTTFCRIYGLAASKAETREDLAFFQEQMGFILNEEIHPHHNFCRAAGVRYEDLQQAPLAPTAHHYTRHMLGAALQGTLGETLTALAPCPWTYRDIGLHLMETVQPQEDHPFYEWITFYGAAASRNVTSIFQEKIDRCAAEAGPAERDRMKRHFIRSTQLEYAFWSMAWEQETWPLEETPAGQKLHR